MKALVLSGIGKLNIEDVPTPLPKEGEVLLKVAACGICGSDIPRAYSTGAHRMPLVIGHEFAGTVEACGEGVDEGLIGKRCGVFPLIPCRECDNCREKRYEMCRNYDYLGSRRDGAFAEYVTVPVWNLLPISDTIAFEDAAMMEPMAVAVHAMRRVSPSGDDIVVVSGLGTIGLLLVMALIDAGVRNIYTLGRYEHQRLKAVRLGVGEDNYCDTRTRDAAEWIMERTAGHGSDVFFECVGSNATLNDALRCAAPSARIMLIGNPHGDMKLDRDDYWKILRSQLTLKGTWNSSFTKEDKDDWHYVAARLGDGRLKPSSLITHRYALADIADGFGLMRDKREDYTKVMCVPSTGSGTGK